MRKKLIYKHQNLEIKNQNIYSLLINITLFLINCLQKFLYRLQIIYEQILSLRFARILFVNDTKIFVSNLSKIKLYLLINYRCFGFLFPNFGAYKLISFSFKTNGKYLFKSSQKLDTIDLLFSEFTELLN